MPTTIRSSPTAVVTYDPDSIVLDGSDSVLADLTLLWVSHSSGANPPLALDNDGNLTSTDNQVYPQTLPTTPNGIYPITLTAYGYNAGLATATVYVTVVDQVITGVS